MATSWYLATGDYLTVNQYITSPLGNYFALLQSDGDFCVYTGSEPNADQQWVWGTEKTGPGGEFYAIMQDDGNFCVYSGTGPTDNQGGLWCAMATGPGGEFFAEVQDDGTFAVYYGTPQSNEGPLWICDPRDYAHRPRSWFYLQTPVEMPGVPPEGNPLYVTAQSNGTVVLEPMASDPLAQLWRMTDDGYIVQAQNPGSALTLQGANKPVLVSALTYGVYQQWEIVNNPPVLKADTVIADANRGAVSQIRCVGDTSQYLNVYENQYRPNTPILTWNYATDAYNEWFVLESHSTPAAQWFFIQTSDLNAGEANPVLTVQDCGMAAGTPIVMGPRTKSQQCAAGRHDPQRGRRRRPDAHRSGRARGGRRSAGARHSAKRRSGLALLAGDGSAALPL